MIPNHPNKHNDTYLRPCFNEATFCRRLPMCAVNQFPLNESVVQTSCGPIDGYDKPRRVDWLLLSSRWLARTGGTEVWVAEVGEVESLFRMGPMHHSSKKWNEEVQVHLYHPPETRGDLDARFSCSWLVPLGPIIYNNHTTVIQKMAYRRSQQQNKGQQTAPHLSRTQTGHWLYG